ncbi:MAG: hypothetical protein JWM87_4548 [Candidatus Eremiobacteraeota bacterium]|nr:hypothetical protein [Candidatus Eremiobacteraeota bacterium]
MGNTHAKIETLLLRHRVPIHARAKILSLRMYYARINIRSGPLSNV